MVIRPVQLPQAKKSPAAAYFPAARAVSSALESLTSVFGMGTGISSPLWPPDIYPCPSGRGPCGHSGRRRTRPHAQKGKAGERIRGINNMVKPHDLLVMLG